MPAESTKEKALDALTGMAAIVKNEMLMHNNYVTPTVVNEKLAKAGAICRGHKACAIGSLWLGAHVRMTLDDEYDGIKYYDMPGVAPDERDDFVKTRPGLKLAYEKINEAAHEYGEKHGLATAKHAKYD